MPHFTPIPTPIASDNKSHQTNVVNLTPDQQDKYHKLLAHFSDTGYRVPAAEDNGELSDAEKFWVSKECLLRYLRASKWDLDVAIKRLSETLKWRRDYGLWDKVTAEHVEPEGVTGKEIIFGFDTNQRPCLYMLPSRQNTDGPERQLQYAVWMMERCIDLMGPGVECLNLLIDFSDRAKNPSLGTAREMLNIIQSHYPERLGLALIINVPFLVNLFFKAIMPFVDPITRAKIKFNPAIFDEGILTRDMVMKHSWAGDCEFEWKHDQYWPALVKMSEDRHAAHMDAWRKLGGAVGHSEWDVRISVSEATGAPKMEDTPVNNKAPQNGASTVATATTEQTLAVDALEKTAIPPPHADPILPPQAI